MLLLLVEEISRLASLIRDGLDRQSFAIDWCGTINAAENALIINVHSGRNGDFQHAVVLLSKKLIGFFDPIQGKPVGYHSSKIHPA